MIQTNCITSEAVAENSKNVSGEIAIFNGPRITDNCMHCSSDLEQIIRDFLVALQTTTTIHLMQHCKCLCNRMTCFVTESIQPIVSIEELISISDLIKPVEICIE